MKAIDYKEMGLRIRKQRELLGYSREQLAEELDVSTKFCADIELGIKGISIQTLAKLSDLLCMDADFILFGTAMQTNDAETALLATLVAKCPSVHKANLIAIVRAFLDSAGA